MTSTPLLETFVRDRNAAAATDSPSCYPTSSEFPLALLQRGVHRHMMMAHDSTPNRPELSAASVDALRSALLAYLDQPSDIARLQPALRRIATEAREKQIHAEQLLIALKDVWYALPQIGHIPASDEQTRLLQRVVTLCIREYYSRD